MEREADSEQSYGEGGVDWKEARWANARYGVTSGGAQLKAPSVDILLIPIHVHTHNYLNVYQHNLRA